MREVYNVFKDGQNASLKTRVEPWGHQGNPVSWYIWNTYDGKYWEKEL